MKKSFVLLITIVLITLLSILSVYILEIKAINSTNIINKYLYIQGKNHLIFLNSYVKSKKNLQNLDEIRIEDINFEIVAKIRNEETKKIARLSVSSKKYNIRLYKKIIIE